MRIFLVVIMLFIFDFVWAQGVETMDETIERVIADHVSAIPHKKFKCEIRIHDGSISGHYTFGLLNKKRGDIGDLEYSRSARASKFDLVDKMSSLRDKHGLPPYGMNLIFNQNHKYSYQILYPNLSFKELSEVDKGEAGFYPDYVYINIGERVISQLDSFSLNQMIPIHVEEARKITLFESDVDYTKSVSNEFYLLMLNIRATGEIDSGSFDHLYSVFRDSPPSIIVDIYNSFVLLENPKWINLFEESIQLYAHFHKNVDQARAELGLASIAKTTESNIMDRYYKMDTKIDDVRATFIRNNPSKFTKELIKI